VLCLSLQGVKRQTLRAPFQSRGGGFSRPTRPLDLSSIILYPLPMAICICQVVEASAGIALRSDQRTSAHSPRRVLTCISNPSEPATLPLVPGTPDISRRLEDPSLGWLPQGLPKLIRPFGRLDEVAVVLRLDHVASVPFPTTPHPWIPVIESVHIRLTGCERGR